MCGGFLLNNYGMTGTSLKSTRTKYMYLPKYVYNWNDGQYFKYRVMRKVGRKILTFGYFDYMYEAKAFAEACFQGDCEI